MKTLTRRNFLKVLGIGSTGALAMVGLASCGSASTDSGSSEEYSGTESSTESSTESTTINANNLGPDGETFLRMCLTSDPGTLDVISSNSGARLQCLEPMYQTLMQVCNGNTYYLLAESVTEIEGEATPTYEVKLFDGITDTNGNSITADDVIFCFNLEQSAGNNSWLKYADSCEKIDDTTLRFVMKDYTLSAFQYLSTTMWIVSQASYEASSDEMATTPVGSGPYILDDYVLGSTLHYTKNPDYWKQNDLTIFETTNVDTFEFDIIKETSQVMIALESGDIDIATSVSAENAASYMNEDNSGVDGYFVDIVSTYGGQMLFLNCNPDYDSPFVDNENLRLAVMHAIDIDAVIMGVHNGFANVCKDIGYGEGLTGYPAVFNDEDYFKYDLDLAKEYFAQSGYKENELTLRIMGTSTTERTTLATILADQIGKLGITVEPLLYENALYESYKTNHAEWDMLLDVMGGESYYTTFWSKMDARGYSDSVRSTSGCDDDKFYELVELACSENTKSEENTIALHEYNNEMAYCRGLYCTKRIDIAVDGVFTNIARGSIKRIVPGGSTYVWNE